MSCVNITKNKADKCNTSVSALADEIKFLSGWGGQRNRFKGFVHFARKREETRDSGWVTR